MITTGGEGHFFKKNENIGFWVDGVFQSDYNFNGQGALLREIMSPERVDLPF